MASTTQALHRAGISGVHAGARSNSSTALLITMYAAAFVAAFNENIINVALSDIMTAFSVSATTAQWLVSGYMIVTAVLTAIMAFLSARFSTRALLFVACGCLIAGELGCLAAPSFALLLAFRILQAASSGTLFGLMMNAVMARAPQERMAFYLAIGNACISLGPAFGPVISGLAIALAGWRGIFIVPLVGGVVVLALGILFAENIGERRDVHLDVPSLALLAVGLAAFVFAVGELSSNLVLGLGVLVASVLVVLAFAARQLRLPQPLLDVRPMLNSHFWPACALVVVAMMTTFSMSVLLPLYFEGAFGMTALMAGLLILPAVVVNAFVAMGAGRIMDAHGPWPLLPAGFALVVAGQAGIALVSTSMNVWLVVALTVVVYAGVGLVLSPSQTTGFAALPAEQGSTATALVLTWDMIAASFGPSLFIGLLSSGAASAAAAGAGEASAQAAGFASAVAVAAVIAAVGLVVAFCYARRERARG